VTGQKTHDDVVHYSVII